MFDDRNCKCRKKLVDILIERSSSKECTENIDKVKIAEMALYGQRNECVYSYTIWVDLTVIALTISIGIGVYFAFSRWYLKKDVIVVRVGTRTQTTIS